MSAINPMWVVIFISVISNIVMAVVAYQSALRGTAVALAKFERDQVWMNETLTRLRNDSDANNELVNEHEVRLAVLEKAIDMRGPPLDYPVRG